jgi:WD repeat-containing protein 17
LLGHGPSHGSEQLRITHIDDLQFASQQQARDLATAPAMKMLGTTLAKKDDRLREAAKIMLKAGNFQEYCNLMIEVGDFEEAIAVAPKVSIKFWRQCIEMYK